MDLDFSELRQLVAALDQTDIAELTLKNPQFELTLRKATAPSQAVVVASESTAASTVMQPMAAPAATAPPAAVEAAPPPAASTSDLYEITSPMVGTFYRSPAPDEPPFVDTGDRIKVGQPVCIIEAMKLMNELEAEVSGEIVEILVQNAEPVEFGQPLMRVKQS